jgi:hypothetical protein
MLMVLWHRGCTKDYLELDDANNRELVESCPTSACEARGNSSCNEMEFTSCSGVLCVDACAESYFNDSEVFCQNSACASAHFESSQVVCNETKACVGATFTNSAVECQLSVGEEKDVSCEGAIWLQWFMPRRCSFLALMMKIPKMAQAPWIIFAEQLFLVERARTGEIQSVRIPPSHPFHPPIQLMNARPAKRLSNADQIEVARSISIFLLVLYAVMAIKPVCR